MATYKVIQDVEAEDKLLGPLTLRQCIYGAIAAVAGYLSFLAISKDAAFLVILFAPFILFGAFFAFPWSQQQPTEVWALAKIRFLLKPRRRIWNQSGVKQLVTITAPKKVILRHRASQLSEAEVTSRLKALAATIDTRGWAVKNVPLSMYNQTSFRQTVLEEPSDRLVEASALPQAVPELSETHELDILDLDTSPIAQKLDSMITASEGAYRQKIMDDLSRSTLPTPQSGGIGKNPQNPPADYWFMNQPGGVANAHRGGNVVVPGMTGNRPGQASSSQNWAGGNLPVVDIPGSTATPKSSAKTKADETALSKSLQATKRRAFGSFGNLKTITPVTPRVAAERAAGVVAGGRAEVAKKAAGAAVTSTPRPATLQTADNNDLDVATIAREARRQEPELADNVTVSLRRKPTR